MLGKLVNLLLALWYLSTLFFYYLSFVAVFVLFSANVYIKLLCICDSLHSTIVHFNNRNCMRCVFSHCNNLRIRHCHMMYIFFSFIFTTCCHQSPTSIVCILPLLGFNLPPHNDQIKPDINMQQNTFSYI